MTINTYLSSTIESKKNKEKKKGQNHRYGEPFDGYQVGGECGGMGENGGVRGLRSTNR